MGLSGPLGLLQPPLSSSLPPSSLFYLSLNPVGHSGPLGSWLPPTFCPLQLSRDSLLSQPPPSRSFRPTRLLASPRNIARGSGTGTLRWWCAGVINPACVSFPPFPSLGFSFSFVDFVVFDLMSGYLSKNSLISLNSTRTLNSWLAISVLIALTSAGWLAISASQCLPLAISRICALLDFKVLALVTVAITTLASHLGIQSFPLSTFTISPAFPKAFWTWCCKQAQRPYHDRTLGKKRKQRLRPCCVEVSKRYTADTYTSWSELPLFLSYFPPVVLLPTPALPLHSGHNPVGHSGPLGYWSPLPLVSRCRPPCMVSPSSLLVTSSLTFLSLCAPPGCHGDPMWSALRSYQCWSKAIDVATHGGPKVTCCSPPRSHWSRLSLI